MENNLEDILVDNIEEKPSSNSKARMIIIGIASVVLLAVLGVLAYVLLKKEPHKNPEFNNTELEKIAPIQAQQPAEDDFDKLIAQIKNKETKENTPEQDSTPISMEVQPQETPQTTPASTPVAPKQEPAVQKAPESKNQTPVTKPAENKKQIQDKPTTKPAKETKAKPAKPATKPAVKTEAKPAKEAKAPSASKAFESVKTANAPKGFYLQVGVFGGKPQEAFIAKLSAHPYKTETIQKGGKILTRYLVGSYASREEAEGMVFGLMQSIGIKPIVVEIK